MVSALTVHCGDMRALWKSKALGVQGHGMLGLLTSSNVPSQIRSSAANHPSSSQVDVASSSGAAVNRLSAYPPIPNIAPWWCSGHQSIYSCYTVAAKQVPGRRAHLFQTGRGKAFKPVESDDARRGRTTDTNARRSGAPHLTPAEWKKAFAAQIDRLQRGRARAESVAKP